MGNFSRQTYDKLKHYVGVRLQQGVPIIDADWNEQEDIRRFELQAFLKWFVGDGIPLGNDGFRIGAVFTANDFEIEAGRCLVQGWDVINDWDQRPDEAGRSYRSQPLYGNDALAKAWEVAPLPPLTTPGASRIDTVYLDVWEREVGAEEDSGMVNPAIGIETSVRIRREWVVRVLEGYTTLPDPPAGHVFYKLASLGRPAGADSIAASHITDLRRTGLTLIPQQDLLQITADAYGQDYTLDRNGEPGLKVSLREAVNALLRNQLPGTRIEQLSQNISQDTRQFTMADSRGAIWTFYRAVGPGTWDIRYNRYDPALRRWAGEVQLTNDSSWKFSSMELVEGSGSVWLFFSRANATGKYELTVRRYDQQTDAWGAETVLTPDVGAIDPAAVVDSTGDVWVFWETTGKIWYKRYSRSASVWGANTQLSTGSVTDRTVRVVVDRHGDLWVFWARQAGSDLYSDIYCRRYSRASSAWGAEERLSFDARNDFLQVPVVDQAGDVWVFWNSDRAGMSDNDVYYRRFSRTGNSWGSETQLTVASGDSSVTSVLMGNDGDLWAFWNLRSASSTSSIWCSRYTTEGGWGRPLQIATEPNNSYRPLGVLNPEGDIWVIWYSYNNNGSIWARKLIPSI